MTVCAAMRRMTDDYRERLQKHLLKCEKCDMGMMMLEGISKMTDYVVHEQGCECGCKPIGVQGAGGERGDVLPVTERKNRHRNPRPSSQEPAPLNIPNLECTCEAIFADTHKSYCRRRVRPK